MKDQSKQDAMNDTENNPESTLDLAGHDLALLAKCQQELAEFKDKYARLGADYQNMMRRIEKERTGFKKMMLSDILLNLLDIFDNVERVKLDISSAQGMQQSWSQAIEFMHKDFLKLFAKYGVQEITDYQVFNPELHEAVMHVDLAGKATGDIAQVLQKGYLLDGQVLRIAKVSIVK